MKFFFKIILKSSAFYLQKQKSLFLKKYFFGRSQYKNKKTLFTGSIFREGFGNDVDNFVTMGRLDNEKQL